MEAIHLAAHYQLDNLIHVLDVKRLGRRGATMYGHDLKAYARRIGAFRWETVCIDGHSFQDILAACENASKIPGRPVMIIAKTIKGKGVSEIEDKDGWPAQGFGQPDKEIPYPVAVVILGRKAGQKYIERQRTDSLDVVEPV